MLDSKDTSVGTLKSLQDISLAASNNDNNGASKANSSGLIYDPSKPTSAINNPRFAAGLFL